MGLYAQDTHVSILQSKGEIERMLRRYGADKLASMESDGRMMIGFEAHGRKVRFEIAIPTPAEFAETEKGKHRKEPQRLLEAEKELRRRWRALLLVVKAKLEAVSSGIAVFEQEFYGYIVMPGGDTLYSLTKEKVAHSIEHGKVPMFNLDGPVAK